MYNNNTTAQPDNYDFVPFPSSVNNTYVNDIQNRRGPNSGYAEIEITTVDNLYIGSGFSHYESGKGILSETQKIIPASSLKGAVRQVARAVSDGCIPQDKIAVPVFKGDGSRIIKPDYRKIKYPVFDANNRRIYNLRKGFNMNPISVFLLNEQRKVCSINWDKYKKKQEINLCIVCDMFGRMSIGSKVRFTDFKAEECSTESVDVTSQFSPDTAAEKYWERKNGRILYKGYKFYKTVCENRSGNLQSISAIKKNVAFKGRVYFSNLTDEQLKLLLFSLGIGGNIFLKLGGYKADGLGTVKTTCSKLFLNGKEENPDKYAADYASKDTVRIKKLRSILRNPEEVSR